LIAYLHDPTRKHRSDVFDQNSSSRMQLDLKGIDWSPTCPRAWNLGREYS
jgi:hypothetical protein